MKGKTMSENVKVGAQIRLFIKTEWKVFVCTDIIENEDERDCVFVCKDNPSLVRHLPEWLADCC